MDQAKCVELILSAIDDVYAGIYYYKKHYPGNKKIIEGLVLVYKKLEKRLKNELNVMLYVPKVGEEFDASKHEAVDVIPGSGRNEQKNSKIVIKEVVLAGAIEIETNRVLRPAKVIAAAVAQ